ncbi:Spo0E family sporulation regulatory protein-aspartic acid phosphatase [Virgibacillus halodenitrificans]|uniref:Spo0E family sporulation regulatory protein-aspartic acid phosphatase n=1 Tax=Virgibacillus halodenitrificans TaxID=1482 RepID=UPI0009FA2FF3|nr:Spo0E family sporulation regulatory protein-aspartic acid phosphatase [Virgibacillus halodenitrificans]MCG1027592.1 Spo0E family sporulation regulatory protein-aspartic acid phosphatase [Virgibacillus halodenitrificans]MEC2157637.1 Spo0E family sporulation regulatory protein-aspartic acid phosphatase [Virgibacillus halodenitrificans]
MPTKKEIEIKVEHVRNKMYHAYKKEQKYEDILILSKKLDELLNQLDKMNHS